MVVRIELVEPDLDVGDEGHGGRVFRIRWSDRSSRPKAELAPRLVHGDGGGVCQVEASAARCDGDHEPLGDRLVVQ